MDPVQTEIMANRFSAIAEEAATVAFRTAHTTFVKQTQDFQVALARLSGEFFAFPMMTGDTSESGQFISGLTMHFQPEDLVEGDVLISNDPFSTDGLVTHQMDIHLVRPVFVDGSLVCYAWSFVHASDIGGAVPGSIAPNLSECFQEGLRIRPTKLVRGSILNQDIVNVIKDNSRIGDAIWGDLEAMMAAMRLLDRRVNELCARVGIKAFREGMDDVTAYSERKARAVIGRLNDGVYRFVDYVEGEPGMAAIHVTCKLTIDGETALVDFSGSSPQVKAAFNFTTGHSSHHFLALALMNYIHTVEPSIPVNGGLMRAIDTRASPGSVLNAEFPAAMGNRFVVVMRCYDALIGCLNQAIPGGVVASGSGQSGVISAAWVDPTSGQTRVAVVEPFSGGSGGRVQSDGVEANDTMVSYLKSTPIEHVEAEAPLIVRRHELVAGRFGHGRYRGGAAVVIELECTAAQLQIMVRGLDRFQFQPWGVFGGTAGCTTSIWLNPDTNPENIGRINVLTLRHGDRVRMISSSGGGFGNPHERLPESVVRDVLDDLLSPDDAEREYGVVIVGDRLDAEATAFLRAKGAGDRETCAIKHGPARADYEALWPEEASVALAAAVLAIPRGLRDQALNGARTALADADQAITPAQAEAAVRRVTSSWTLSDA